MNEHDQLTTLRRLKELNARQQDWVWDCAKQLHDAGWATEACFKAALNARDWTNTEPCEACGARDTIYPYHHHILEQGCICPLAELDNPAYAAHCILTEPEGSSDHRERLTRP